jgi:hypothetical protein
MANANTPGRPSGKPPGPGNPASPPGRSGVKPTGDDRPAQTRR